MSSNVHVEPSGREFTVEGDESVLDAALRNGLSFPYGCRNGACGACKCKITQGEVEYGDDEPMALSDDDAANGYMLPCVGRPKGDLRVEVNEVEAAADIPVRQYPTKVAKFEKLNEEVLALWLKLPEESRMQYLAGQYVEFLLEDGKKRAFSIANSPHQDALLEFHIRHIKGGRFTEHAFSDLKEGEIIRIEGPRGTFFLREDSDRPIIMMATGTGFGPIKAIIEHALGEGCTRPIYLYWGARNTEELYKNELATHWDSHYKNIHYRPVLSRPAPEENWEGRIGYVQHAVMEDFEDLSGYELYACGHPDMVYSAKDALVERGMDPDHCFSDAFSWAKD